MRNITFLATVFLLLISTVGFSQSKVSKVSADGGKVMLQSDGEQWKKGQKVALIHKGKKVGEVQVLKVSSSGEKAIAQIIRGKAMRGLVAMDARQFAQPKKKQVAWEDEGWDDENFDSEYEEESPRRRRKPSSEYYGSGGEKMGFVGATIGYDIELMEEFVDGGLQFGAQAAYKLTPEWGVGGRIARTSGSIGADNHPVFGTFSIDAAALYLMVDGLYFLQPNFFVGPSLGYAMLSCDGCDGTNGLAFGGTAGYDYMVTDDIAVGGRVNVTYMMLNQEDLFEKLFTVTVNAAVSYWF